MFKVINQIIIDKSEYIEKKSNLKRISANNKWININEKIKRNLNEN